MTGLVGRCGLGMTAESRDRSHNDNWVERRTKEKSQEREASKRNKGKRTKRGTKKKKTTC